MDDATRDFLWTLRRITGRCLRHERLRNGEGTPILRYSFPKELEWPRADEIVDAAGRFVRAKNASVKEKTERRLRELLETAPRWALLRWSLVPMIDNRYQGATGEGGYIASASAAVNRMARDIMNRNPMFTLME